MPNSFNASTGQPEKKGMTSEVTISLVVVGLLVTMLLVAIAVVLVYYWNQSRRMTQPKQSFRQPGYRTTLNSDKLKKYAAAKVRGVDEMKEPVNWSNRFKRSRPSVEAMQPQRLMNRCRSLSPLPTQEQLQQGRHMFMYRQRKLSA